MYRRAGILVACEKGEKIDEEIKIQNCSVSLYCPSPFDSNHLPDGWKLPDDSREVIGTFLGNGDSMQRFTIYELRLPRVVLAVIVASALGVSGGVLQAVTRNPLSEPGMIGINAGAALFVVVWISAGTSAYYSELAASKAFFMPLLAIMGSLLTVAVIYLFSYKRGIRPVRFILTGVGVNAGITAVISFYQLNMSKGDYNQVLTWTNGSLWGSSWNYIIITLPLILVLIFSFCSGARYWMYWLLEMNWLWG